MILLITVVGLCLGKALVFSGLCPTDISLAVARIWCSFIFLFVGEHEYVEYL